MSSKYRLDARKALEVVVYIAKSVHDRHGILKALYIADCQHIREYGRSLYSEEYRAMQFGPVGTTAYDLIKVAAGENESDDREIIQQGIEAKGKKYVAALREPDRKMFSDSDVECLDAAIKKCRWLSFQARTNLTHDAAYLAAGPNGWITTNDIARQAPNSEALLDYLHNG